MPELGLPPEGEIPPRSIFHTLILGLFVVALPAALLAVLAGSTAGNIRFESRAFQTILLVSSALLALLIAHWLYQEAQLSRHPAVMVLAVGFAGLAVFHTGSAWLRDPLALAWSGFLSNAWVILFSLASILFIAWRAARHAGRNLLERNPKAVWAAGAALFLFFPVASLALARAEVSHGGVLAQLGAWFNAGYLVAAAFAAFFTFWLYWKRRTVVLLSFALAVFLFGLSVAARMLGPTGHLLWWYAHVLISVSLFLVAYGILEGNRVREREVLIAQLASVSKRLEQQSVRDPLTGCFNRRYATEALEAEFRKSFRARMPLTLLVADLDDFKAINDTYGHPSGDFVLLEATERLHEEMRTSDILARCGGEEFWIILPLTNRVGGQQVASKLLEALRSRPFEQPTYSLHVTMSVGIADNLTPGVTDTESLIREADRALYSAKHSGKDRAVVLDPLSFSVPQMP